MKGWICAMGFENLDQVRALADELGVRVVISEEPLNVVVAECHGGETKGSGGEVIQAIRDYTLSVGKGVVLESDGCREALKEYYDRMEPLTMDEIGVWTEWSRGP